MPRKKQTHDELAGVRKLLEIPNMVRDMRIAELEAEVGRLRAENTRLKDRLILREGECTGLYAALKAKTLQ